MSHLKLTLLGSPRVELNGHLLQIPRRKGLALLAYLALNDEEQRRDSLATFFWPESPQAAARTTLRGDLYHLRQLIGEEWLELGREQVRWRRNHTLWIDTKEFDRFVTERIEGNDADGGAPERLERLVKAVDLYRGDFMAGFSLTDSPAFDEWQFLQAERYRLAVSGALAEVIHRYLKQANFGAALPYAQRWCALDPLHEPAHRALMQLYAASGRRNQALHQYESCKRILAQELGVAPHEATAGLYEAILHQKTTHVAEVGSQLLSARERFSQSPPTMGKTVTAPVTQASLPTINHSAFSDEVRLITIVVAGIAHSAEQLWSLHPDELVERVAQFKTEIGGILAPSAVHTDHTLEGSIVAAFGALRAHEDDPERAIQSALQIQQVAQRLAIPTAIGVHSGPVYLYPDDTAGAKPFLGATLNLASRLQGIAGAGEILVSQKVYRQTRLAFEYGPVHRGDQNVAQPPATYRLLRPRSRNEKSRGIEGLYSPLVGRDSEIAKLIALTNALQSGQGHVVVISGEAGVGKSRLITTWKERIFAPEIIAPQLLWMEGRSLEMSMNVGYAPFLDMLRSYFAWTSDESEQPRGAQIVTALHELQEGGQLTPPQVEKIGPALGNLFALHFGNAWDEQIRKMQPEQIRRQTFQAIYELLVALAQRHPLILVFEDLHWSDGTSLDLIAQLMVAVASSAILIVCICRPEEKHRSNQLATVALRKAPTHLVEMTLRELAPQQSRQLLHTLLGQALTPKAEHFILARTQGNPFFMEELLYTLMSMELVYRQGDGWRERTHLDEAVVPYSIQNLILSRLDRLSVRPKEILQRASVIGRLFPLRLLSALLPAVVLPTPHELEEIFWQLEDKAFIYQERTVPEVVFIFRHIVTHEAIYATIPQRRLKQLHGEVGELLESLYTDELAEHYEQLAYHFERSQFPVKAVAYLFKAAAKARRSYLNEEVVGYYSRVLLILDDMQTDRSVAEQKMTALFELGKTYYYGTTQLGQAENSFRAAIAVAKTIEVSPLHMVRLLVWTGDLLMNWQPRYQESLKLGYEALALLGDDNPSVEFGLANALISFSYLMMGELDAAYDYAMRNAAFARHLTCSDEFDHLIYGSISCAYIQRGEREKALPWIHLSARVAEEYQHLRPLGEAQLDSGCIVASEGNITAGLAILEKALDVLQQAGDVKRANWCEMAILWAYLQIGDLDSFGDRVASTLMNAELVNQEYLNDMHLCLAISALAQKDWQAAEASLQRASQLAAIGSHTWVECQIVLGHTYLAQQRKAEAMDVFKAAASASLAFPDLVRRLTRNTNDLFAALFDALAGLEAASIDDEEVYLYFDKLAQGYTGDGKSTIVQWRLAKSEPTMQRTQAEAVLYQLQLGDPKGVTEEWVWYDPLGDCSINYDDGGITMQAVNARSLWLYNMSAPRLMHPIEGNFALQTRCDAASVDKPAMGGVVLWESQTNFVHLNWGAGGKGEVVYNGCVARHDIILGRGRIRSQSATLRLERVGESVRALCSDNGDDWYSVGQIQFPASGPLFVGLVAIGNIDRWLYPGVFGDGTAIRFSDISLWQIIPTGSSPVA